MGNAKKSAVGHVAVWTLLDGGIVIPNNALNAKTVVYSLPAMMLNSDQKIDLFGLGNGYLNDKLLKPLIVIAVCQLIRFNVYFMYLKRSPTVSIIKREHVHMRMDATYFKHFCMLCYQDHEDGYTQLIRFSTGEHFEEIKKT